MPSRSLAPAAALAAAVLAGGCQDAATQRDKRWPPRGPWAWSVREELPRLYAEFNGIDFGHAHLAETLLRTQDPAEVERARQDVLRFIESAPAVPPDEEQIAPGFTRMAWDLQKTFNWTHVFHRALYDLFAADAVADKESTYRAILENYLAKPEAITTHRLDHHGKLWSFPESRAFRDAFPLFNSQIWAYHWLQAAAYDVQLRGDAARQRDLFEPVIAHYHGYLREPPIAWKAMPMFHEVAPDFTRRFPEAAAVFDNLHMLHDNADDVLCRPDLYPTAAAKRERIREILAIYLHRNHVPEDRFAAFHADGEDGREGHPPVKPPPAPPPRGP